MKSLKNKKCIYCGNPASMWVPEGDGEVEVPICEDCLNTAALLALDNDDSDECDASEVDLY